MIRQTLCFSNPCRLSLKMNQLQIQIKRNDVEEVHTRPIEDIGVVILESRQIQITNAVLSALIENNVAVITCNDSHMPSGLMLPLVYNTMQTEKALHQIQSSQPLKKQLWQQTVAAKISNQAALLSNACDEETSCMNIWAKSVKSGDPDNIEARAANFYWHNLFPRQFNFKRGDDSLKINALLNYGYAILRAIIARALVATGLIPTIGIFHSNKYNGYCLADDIMEPYRPYVDSLVLEIVRDFGPDTELSKEVKMRLLTLPVVDVVIGRFRRPLIVAATSTAASLAKCYSGELRKILYPDMKMGDERRQDK